VRDIVAELAASGLMATEVVSYDQPALSLSDEASAALSEAGLLMLPLFSPRAAKLASAVFAPAHATLAVVAISAAVAKAAAALAPAQIVVAERPDADAMLEALGAVSLPA
jgi:uroporphyrinogen-III synthase